MGELKVLKFREGNLRLGPVETGGQRRKPCQKHPLNGYTVIYMGKEKFDGRWGSFWLRPKAGIRPGRNRTPVLSTFLALPNAIFKAQSRNSMTPAKQ